jgi:proteasome accessory factor A
VGTAQIMLRLLEDGALGPGWALADPLDAIRRISRDPACEVRVPLADGRALSALDLQRAFCEAAQRYFARAAPTPAEAQVVEHWARTLCDLGTDPWLLAGRLDWVTKRLIIGQLAAEAGWDWDSPQAQEADMQYHALYPPESLFYELEEAGLIAYPPGWSADAVNRLVEQPPAGARAFVRGTCVARFAPDIIRMDWEYVQFRSGTLALPDPLRGGEAELPPDLSQVTAAGQPAQPPAAPLPLNGETK